MLLAAPENTSDTLPLLAEELPLLLSWLFSTALAASESPMPASASARAWTAMVTMRVPPLPLTRAPSTAPAR